MPDLAITLPQLDTQATQLEAILAAVNAIPAQTAALVAAAASVATPVSVPPVVTPHHPGDFDAAWYLEANPDVKAAGMAPYQHYVNYGRWEGRLPYDGATAWRPASPSEWAQAPAPLVECPDVWVPSGSKTARVRFSLTRFRDGTACERSYAMVCGVVNRNTVNITGQPHPMAVGEVLTLPSTGSQGEFVINLPGGDGNFSAYIQSQEYNPRAQLTTITVYVGGQQPAGTQRGDLAPLALPSPTPYPTLGKPDYQTDFLNDIFSDGWRCSRNAQINNMVGAWVDQNAKTASGKPIDVYPIVDAGAGGKVRAIQVVNCTGDPAQGKYLYATGLLSRVFGDGKLGFRRSTMTFQRMKGADPAYWGIHDDDSWPPEFDTHEAFATGEDRLYQTIHMPVNGAPTLGFTPLVSVDGKHEWMEEFSADTYRLWIDQQLVVERPHYLVGETLTTIHSIEGPGGAGGALDASQDYGSLRLLLHGDAWWQR